ncbi:GumC family protein [Pedobacter endophyticus]|uniref:Polysaccharide biosynthesis tyrosine autokinase n=1 Tax=Pedobacter endophyticus TaxID=2789740 RepID=A0A7S9L2H4_9SPHI|nr:polysaccharide biosynthesis tyrosine autokinase [Pedobacter endophyticus]QPH41290.1 polysaccharide biosynthesis tyrosine autokinase [Pedobacter endophyticus]
MNIIKNSNEPKVSGGSKGLMIFKLLPYWPLFLGLFIVAVVSAWIYLQITPQMFSAEAKILINEKKGAEEVNLEDPMSSNLSKKKSVDNEREVIVSSPIINQVVDDLSLYATVYAQGFLSNQVMYKDAPVRIALQNPNTLIPTKSKVKFTYTKAGVVIDEKAYDFNKWHKTPYGVMMFQKSESALANDDRTFAFTLSSPKKVAATIASGVKVAEANKLSTILVVSVLDENPKRAEDILNGILQVYNKNAIDQHNLLAANTQNFISNRLLTVEKELLDIENKLQKYKSSNGAIDVGTQGKLYLENVSVNDQKIGEINMQLSVLNQIENYVRSRDLTGGIVPSTAGINDPGLSQMVKDIYELQLNAESLRKTTGENNPAMVAYNDQINKIKPQILQNLRNQRNSLAASRNNLSGTTSTYSSALQSMPETERNLVDITRQQQIKSGIYTFLLQKKEETALSYIANGSDSQIVSGAEASEYPVSPKRKMIYLAAVFGAGILGIGFVAAKEKMRRNIMFQHEIQSLTKLPVIAEISANSSPNQIVIGSSQRTLIAEQFRSLRTTLHYLGIGKQNKRLMVTSAIAGEGKSFVASNLAVTLAMTGKRVALLDFDLNHPTIHHKFGIKQAKGISEYLEGKASVEEIIQDSNADPNLFLLLTGKLPVDPAELILNGKAEELLTYLDEHFDYLIIDVPPIGPVSDAYAIAPLCDATLFVVRHAYTPKVFIERIDENIKLNNLPNPAIVFNAVAQRGYGKNNYGYGYGSGMVYGGTYDQKLIQ